jgi:hypothetical protein
MTCNVRISINLVSHAIEDCIGAFRFGSHLSLSQLSSTKSQKIPEYISLPAAWSSCRLEETSGSYRSRQNLDYSGAGHLDHPNVIFIKAEFVARIRKMQFYARMVRLESLEKESHQERFQKVNVIEGEMYTQSPLL